MQLNLYDATSSLNGNYDFYMRQALDLAAQAARQGEVPVGAVLVAADGEIIAAAHNLKEQLHSATAHAEMLVIEQACKRLGQWRLQGTTLFVTLEPCFMCAGAIVQARIPKVVFATHDPKAGAVGSLTNVLSDTRLNHRCEVVTGIASQAAAILLQTFFKEKRKKQD